MGKGEDTRASIVNRAIALSSTLGLEGISIGMLADDLKLSKSGLFAHFRSKEALQMAVIEQASEVFTRVVVKPTLAAPRGEARLRAAFENWRTWPERSHLPGGCFFLAAAAEYDDRPGPVRDAVAAELGKWLAIITEITRRGVREGELRAELDPEQVTFELFSLILGYHQLSRLLDRKDAKARVTASFEALMKRVLPAEMSQPKRRGEKNQA